jgi:antitoxin component of RelBE/YafQ-DinJ toxin-antitoxin module
LHAGANNVIFSPYKKLLTQCIAVQYNTYIEINGKGGISMQSQLTVRLPEDLEREVSNCAKKLRLKRSDIVRMALERFLRESYVPEQDIPYKKVRNLIGAISSGVSDLGSSHRKHLLKRIKEHA